MRPTSLSRDTLKRHSHAISSILENNISLEHRTYKGDVQFGTRLCVSGRNIQNMSHLLTGVVQANSNIMTFTHSFVNG